LAVKKGPWDWIAIILLIFGGLNLGMAGLFGFDLITFLFGTTPLIAKTAYILIGLSAVYMIYYYAK
jgi:uncharacterized protein